MVYLCLYHAWSSSLERAGCSPGGEIRRYCSSPLVTTAVYLGFLGAIPDTLIGRKFGRAQAIEVQEEANALQAKFDSRADADSVERDLVAFDRSLKARGLNPGTSADLTVATLFAASLQALEIGC